MDARYPHLLLKIKLLLKSIFKNIKLAHVLAHTNVLGNEHADMLAKAATEFPIIDTILPLPFSFVKRFLKHQRDLNWQNYWDYSDKGRYTYNYISKVSHHVLPLNRFVTAFLTGHGPFRAYLHRFHIKDDYNCECGAAATPEHFYYHCPLTATWHLKKPAHSEPPGTWLDNILHRPSLRWKLYKIYSYLMDVTNRT